MTCTFRGFAMGEPVAGQGVQIVHEIVDLLRRLRHAVAGRCSLKGECRHHLALALQVADSYVWPDALESGPKERILLRFCRVDRDPADPSARSAS